MQGGTRNAKTTERLLENLACTRALRFDLVVDGRVSQGETSFRARTR